MLTNIMLKAAGSAVLRSGKDAHLSILIYHRVLPKPDPMIPDELDAETFGTHMDALAEDFSVLPLGEAIERLETGSLPSRSACITFDDGYANNATVALDILRDRSLTACFFISTGFTGGKCMWNDIVIEAFRNTTMTELDMTGMGLGSYSLGTTADRRDAVSDVLPRLKLLDPVKRGEVVEEILSVTKVDRPRGMMMSPEQIRQLHDAGMEIGGHTVSHPILATIDEDAAVREIAGCRDELNGILGQPVELFAYPNGRPEVDFTLRDVGIVRRLGFKAAVTTSKGTSRRGTDPYLLPRFTPWDGSRLRFTLRMLQNAVQDLN